MPKNKNLEYKSFKFEVKEHEDDEDSKFHIIEGVMSTQGIDDGDDIVLAEAVLKSIQEFGMPKFLFNHDQGKVLGVIDEVKQDIDGRTLIKGRMPKGVKLADETAQLARMGAFGGMSIGFRTLERDFKDGVRIIKRLRIFENSVVAIPMNGETAVTSVKKIGDGEMLKKIEDSKNLSDIETVFEDLGLSQKESKALISKVSEFKAQRDVEEKSQRDADEKAEKEESEKAQRDAESTEVKSGFGELIEQAKSLGAEKCQK